MAFASIKNGVDYATIPTSSVTPTTSTQLVNKAYVDTNFLSAPLTATYSYTGTLLNPRPFFFSMRGLWNNGVLTSPLLHAYSNLAAEPLLLTFDYGNIQIIENAFLANATLTALTAPSLVAIVGPSMAGTLPLITSWSFPNLVYLTNFTATLAGCTTLSMPSLVEVNSTFSTTMAILTTFSLPALSNANGGFAPVIASCTTFSVPALAYVGSAFAGTYTALTSMSLPAIIRFETTFSLTISTAPNLVTFSLGSTLKHVGGNFTLSGAKLDQASVDGILVSLAALDGTNGTTAYSSKVVTLTGGTNATPSATGLTAKTTLQGRGCTVTNN